jgi:hypothetical protein
MKTVYILAEVDYEDYNLIKVFETKDSAESYMNYMELENKLMDEIWEIKGSMLELFEEDKISEDVYNQIEDTTEKIYKMLLGYSFKHYYVESVDFVGEL